jgi:hypothetical protein
VLGDHLPIDLPGQDRLRVDVCSRGMQRFS